MPALRLIQSVALAVIPLALGVSARAQEPAKPALAKPGEAVAALTAEAEKVQPLVQSDAVRAFLAGVAELPQIAPRTVYRAKDRSRAFTEGEAAKLPEGERAELEKREYDESFYYYTGYGSPLMYARPLDIAAAAGMRTFSGKRILDFGYGTVGHLRLLAGVGADCVGVDVEPVFRALYSGAGDQGAVRGRDGRDGKITLVTGRYPAEAEAKQAVGGGYDLILSKNTLKLSYIHPEREVDERFLVKLGVDDETFVRTVFEALKPGGLLLIYNLAPAQNPPDKPYLAHANGKCPFDRALLEKAGFQIVEFDKDDQAAALDYWMALGFNRGQSREEQAADLFAHYTLARRPASGG